MNWSIKSFEDLSKEELYKILVERTQVFVVEQDCPYLEVDGKDPDCFHVFAEQDGEIIAYLRVLPPGVSFTEVSLGRVLIKQAFRGQRLGVQLVQRGLDFVRNEWKGQPVKIQAQAYLHKFYSEFGFVAVSDVYLEDDIPHLDMIL